MYSVVPLLSVIRANKCGRRTPVSSGSQHGDGLEEVEPTHRNDATTATRGFLWFPGRSHLSPDGRAATRAAVHRLAADGYDSTADNSGSPDVATCRQTVEALLAPLSTAWQRMATIRQRTIRFLGRSHLSPDGGGVTRAAVHRLAADVYDSAADDSIPRP